MAWLCVAAMPIPSHSAINRSPADPSHGRSRTSRTNSVGPSSPSGTAVVIMYDVTPEPLPKCLSPVIWYVAPGNGPSPSPSGCARPGPKDVATAARLRRDRPPLLAGGRGGERAPCAVASTWAAPRPAAPARSRGPPRASRPPGPPRDRRAASVRSTSQIGRVLAPTLRHRPPMSSGTATRRNPACASRSKSALSRPRRA